MMSYIQEIFERANLHSICYYLSYGAESYNTISGTFEEREKKAHKHFSSELMKRMPDIDEEDPIFSELANILTEYKAIHMEIGILVGLQLSREIKNLDKTIKE